jgi:hypothetical protein
LSDLRRTMAERVVIAGQVATAERRARIAVDTRIVESLEAWGGRVDARLQALESGRAALPER